MVNSAIKKQIAREYYNVLYGAKLNFSSLDICEKLPTIISVVSLSFGVLGLAFAEFNTKALAALLLIIGIIGLVLKPREAMKSQYAKAGDDLTALSKELENLYEATDTSDENALTSARAELTSIQTRHRDIESPAQVFLSSWYAHYKVFSEHNSDWMCTELNLTWKDKIPGTLRATILVVFIGSLLWIDPYCIATKSWEWVSEPCVGCWSDVKATSPGVVGETPSP